MTSDPPPIPDDCGSTKPSTSCAAIAASIGLPPCSRMSNAARVAKECAVVAACCAGNCAIACGAAAEVRCVEIALQAAASKQTPAAAPHAIAQLPAQQAATTAHS